ncbi:MAG: polysaccharide export protein [Balneolia bacterium]|nr:polysaccharide export protein [Balneolia bacterium]
MSSTTTQRSTDTPTYRIRPGDEIEVLVWEHPNFNVLTTVSSTGSIAVPLVGEMRIAGLTQEEFEQELSRRLSTYIRDEISLTISIRNTESLMVSVFGMVTRPDNYPVVDEISIFRLLSTAGGPTENANMRKVHLYRQSGAEDSAILDLTEYLDSGRMEDPAILVRQGDIIYIPRKDNAVREMSEFLRDVVVLFGIFRIFN